MNVVPAGEDAWLLTWDDPDEATANRRARRARESLGEVGLAGVVDLIPAARSLLVIGDASLDPRRLGALAEPAGATGPETGVRRHELPVAPDGADLAEVLSSVGMSSGELWSLLAAVDFTVGFLGFSPGFPYLYGLPSELHLPRRASPRTLVPAGSVALAGPYAGIYPSPTPGGWNLIGTTPVRLFDPADDPPARLRPGDVVRFVPVS